MRLIFLLLAAFSVGNITAQQEQSTGYLAEFRILVESLKELHPSLYTNISAEDFDLRVKTIESRLSETDSRSKAIYIIQELFYYLSDSHSGNISIYRQDLEITKALPFSVYILGNQLYIKDYPANQQFQGVEIHAIGQSSASDIIDSLKIFFPVDGPRSTVSPYFPMMFNRLYGAFCQQTDTFNIVTNKGSFHAIAIERGDSLYEQFILKPDAAYFGEDRILKATLTEDYGYFKCVGFVREYKEFEIEQAYYDLLKELRSKNVSNLIIDLRNNSGGDPYMAAKMVSYLVDRPFRIFEHVYITSTRKPKYLNYMSKKMMYRMRHIRCKKAEELEEVVRFEKGLKTTGPQKNRFTGQIYVLTNGATQSTSTMFCRYLMDQSNVTFVGSETMGAINYFWAGQHCKLTLPTLKTTFSFGLELIELNEECGSCGLPVGLIPDHITNYTIEDLLEGRDLEMELVLADIKERSSR